MCVRFYAHVYGILCSCAFWLAETVALAVTCWALLNKLVAWNNKMVQEREPGWRGDELSHWPDPCQYSPASFLPVLPHLHCLFLFFFNLTFSHPRGLKIVGLSIWMDSDRLKRMWSLSWDKVLESYGEGIPWCVVLFAYFTWRQSCDDLWSPPRGLGIAPHRQKCLSLQPCALKADACCDLLTV